MNMRWKWNENDGKEMKIKWKWNEIDMNRKGNWDEHEVKIK